MLVTLTVGKVVTVVLVVTVFSFNSDSIFNTESSHSKGSKIRAVGTVLYSSDMAVIE